MQRKILVENTYTTLISSYGLFTWSKGQNFLQIFCKSIWNLDLFLWLKLFSRRGSRMRDRWPLVPFFFGKNASKNCAKILQKMCKNFATNVQIFCKMRKKIFLLCKIFAKILQIWNLHTDFRPHEQAVTYLFVFLQLIS